MYSHKNITCTCMPSQSNASNPGFVLSISSPNRNCSPIPQNTWRQLTFKTKIQTEHYPSLLICSNIYSTYHLLQTIYSIHYMTHTSLFPHISHIDFIYNTPTTWYVYKKDTYLEPNKIISGFIYLFPFRISTVYSNALLYSVLPCWWRVMLTCKPPCPHTPHQPMYIIIYMVQ